MILVFKTSIKSMSELDNIASDMNHFLGEEATWNVDLEDCDNILRVVTDQYDDQQIEYFLLSRGYFCKSLED